MEQYYNGTLIILLLHSLGHHSVSHQMKIRHCPKEWLLHLGGSCLLVILELLKLKSLFSLMWQVKAACYEHHYEKCFKNHSWPCFRVGLDQMTFRDPFQPKLLYNILKCLFPLLFQIHFPSIFLLALTNTLDYITHSFYWPHKLLSHIFNQLYGSIHHLASPWFFH